MKKYSSSKLRSYNSKKRRTKRLYKRPYGGAPAPLAASRPLSLYQSLPPIMHLSIPVLGDSYVEFDTYHATQHAQTQYIYWDLLDFSQNLNNLSTGSSGLNWFYNQFINMMAIYAEGRYRAHKFSIDLSLDAVTTNYIEGNSQNPPDRLDVGLGIVPLSYLRTVSGVPHVYTNAGNWFNSVDYYSALTHHKGAKFFSLTTDGSKSNMKASVMCSGYDHTGSTVSALASNSWPSNTELPSTTIRWPSQTERQMVLLVLRYRTHNDSNVLNKFGVRMSCKMDNHMQFCDLQPQWPIATTSDIN